MAMSSYSLPLGTSEGANMAFNSSVSSPTSTSVEDNVPNVPLFTNLQLNNNRHLGGEAGSGTSKLASSGITIDHLPDELMLEIFSYVGVTEIINILQVCRRWEILAQDARLWQHKKYVVRKDTSEDEAIATFAALPQLRTVILEKCVSPEVLQALSRSCPHLTSLELDADHMLRYSEAVELFDRCKKIRTLAFSNWIPQVDEHIMDAVARLADLRVLHLKDWDYTCVEIPLRSLADGCPHLCDFDLLGLCYDFEDAEYFISTHRHVLKSLYINWTASDQRNIVPLLPACAETLECLELLNYDSDSHAESAEVFAALGQLHNLRHLRFDVTEWEGEHLVPAVFENGRLAKLQWLQFDEVVTDETIRAVVEHCPELQELTLRRCKGHTDTLFEWLCRHEKLEILKIDNCRCLAGRAMSYIAKLPALHTLEFNCTKFGNLKPGVDCILEMSGLRRLSLRESTCSAIPFDKFPGRLVNLRELEVEASTVDPFVEGELQARMPDLRVKIC